MRTALVGLLAALLAVTALTGCGADATVDEVTVSVGGVSVTLPPALSCFGPTGADQVTCAGGENDDDAPHLALAGATPLTVEVPAAVGDTPWVIVFAYTDADGEPQGDRTAVFPAAERYSYQLTPPAGAQLTRLEVQSLTAAPVEGGGVEFPAVGTWVLLFDPVSAPE